MFVDQKREHRYKFEELLRVYGAQLPTAACQTLEALVDSGKLRAIATQMEAMQRLISEVSAQRDAAHAELLRVDDELSEATNERTALDAERREAVIANARLQGLGHKLAETFVRAQALADQRLFGSAWYCLTRERRTAAVASLMISLYVVRSRYVLEGDVWACRVALALKNAHVASMSPQEFRDFLAGELEVLRANVSTEFDEADWGSLQRAWTIVMDAPETRETKALIGDVLGLGDFDVPSLQEVVTERAQLQLESAFVNQWTRAFEDGPVNTAPLACALSRLLDGLLTDDPVRNEYKMCQAELATLDRQVENQRALVKTMQRNADEATREQDQIEVKTQVARLERSALASKRSDFNARFASNVIQGDVFSIRPEGSRLRLQEELAVARLREYEQVLAHANTLHLVAQHKVQHARQELQSMTVVRDQRAHELQAKAAELNEKLGATTVVSLTNHDVSVPASMEWFDAIIIALNNAKHTDARLRAQGGALADRIETLLEKRDAAAAHFSSLGAQQGALIAQLAALRVAHVRMGDIGNTMHAVVVALSLRNRESATSADAIERQLKRMRERIAAAEQQLEDVDALRERIIAMTFCHTRATERKEKRDREDVVRQEKLDAARQERQRLYADLTNLRMLVRRAEENSREQRLALVAVETAKDDDEEAREKLAALKEMEGPLSEASTALASEIESARRQIDAKNGEIERLLQERSAAGTTEEYPPESSQELAKARAQYAIDHLFSDELFETVHATTREIERLAGSLRRIVSMENGSNAARLALEELATVASDELNRTIADTMRLALKLNELKK